MRRHRAVGQRYLALAGSLQFRQKRAIATALFAQRLDLFREILRSRAARRGFRDIAFLETL
jgi:hypothetical protein